MKGSTAQPIKHKNGSLKKNEKKKNHKTKEFTFYVNK